jgi:ferredoxin
VAVVLVVVLVLDWALCYLISVSLLCLFPLSSTHLHTINTLHATDTPIHVGDVIIGVFDDKGFKESTTALDYDETVDIINRAKTHSLDHGGHGKLTLELNRLVKRATVQVEIEDAKTGQVTQTIQGLAGDNLRLLLLHNHVAMYDDKTHRLDQPFMTGSNCAGEGICGTCLVAVQQGMDHLNKIGPQEESILMNRPAGNWRAACKTVVGADNQADTTLRILLHPQTTSQKDDEETRVRP